MTGIFEKIDIEKVFNKAQKMTRDANSEKEYKAAAREWMKLHFDGCEFYFQDKVDYCLEMAAKCKAIETDMKKFFKEHKT